MAEIISTINKILFLLIKVVVNNVSSSSCHDDCNPKYADPYPCSSYRTISL